MIITLFFDAENFGVVSNLGKNFQELNHVTGKFKKVSNKIQGYYLNVFLCI